jgi:hypothetical protein
MTRASYKGQGPEKAQIGRAFSYWISFFGCIIFLNFVHAGNPHMPGHTVSFFLVIMSIVG